MGKGAKKSKRDDEGGRAAEAGGPTLDKKAYADRLEPLQVELNRMARWLQATGKRLVVVVEGRDTAGKGGVISAIGETLNPRTAGSSRCPGRPSARRRSGTSSAMSRTCRPQARSCCSTAAGTTAPASSA